MVTIDINTSSGCGQRALQFLLSVFCNDLQTTDDL